MDMLLITHFVTSAVLAGFLYPFYGLNVLFVFIGGFFIDIDHYIYTLFKFKSLNIINSYKFYRKIMKLRKFKEIKKQNLYFKAEIKSIQLLTLSKNKIKKIIEISNL